MSDCLVVGGGIIGLMSARVLAMSGADVVLLEQNACGKQSSWAAGGILSPLYPWHYDDEINALSFESQAIYQQLCADLLDTTGIDPEYQKTGLLMLDEFGSPSAKAWLKKYQINFQKQPPGALFADIATVRNPRLLQALRADISNKKVQIFENIQAENVLMQKILIRKRRFLRQVRCG
ncbi:MAG: FAD-dependent oxidoreductase, partial [Betaproteobacteria bacterium]|nr:FAD-dependent oxidoreductase [Betaproteobacteria bacterium]